MTVQQIKGLVSWSFLRQRYLFVTFSIVQILLACAIIFGMSLISTEVTSQSGLYLSTGAVSIGIISVGCVLAPQMMSQSKKDGLVEYQRTLPVSRHALLISEIIIWSVTSVPGIVASLVAGHLKYQSFTSLTWLTLVVLIVAQVTMVVIGFTIAYWIPVGLIPLVTQLVMFVTLLFSPIIFPKDRLPDFLNLIYECLPFVPVGNLIRASLSEGYSLDVKDLFIVTFWLVMAYCLSIRYLNRKD